MAVARGPVVLVAALAGLALALVPAIGVALVAVVVGMPLGPRNGVLVALLALGGEVLLVAYGIPWSLIGVRRLAGLTRRRAASWTGLLIPDPYRPRPHDQDPAGLRRQVTRILDDPASWRDLLWIVVNASVGWVLAMTPTAIFAAGLIALMDGAGVSFPNLTANPNGHPLLAVVGAGMLLLALWVAPVLFKAYFGLAGALLGPRGDAEMVQRVRHLTQTRAESLDTSAAEIRRIERDLHDGTQARLVAMGMTLSAANDLLDTDPEATRRLLTDAVDASAKALAELRALIRGIHPPVLADRGIVDAVRALALDTPLPVQVDAALAGRPSAPVESAAYFAVSELLANASRHSGAHGVRVQIASVSGTLWIMVTDDGQGGINPARGSGLRGIERRLAVFDGSMAISSPPGGPSVIRLEIPCELSSPKTSSC
ncbi:MAG: sensor histidine kinase [Acidimicrobiales bacterium]